MKQQISLICFLLSGFHLFSQIEKSSDLYKSIKEKDSLLFYVGFNTCDISQFENLVSDNFEFYHDQAGIIVSKSAFISGIRDRVCKLDYKPKRVLVENSLEVYPLKQNGVLYGAIQTGIHHFYAIEKGKPEYLTSVAKFTHVWLLENETWKLAKGLSYDHRDFAGPFDEKLLFSDRKETERWLLQKQVPAMGIGWIKDGEIKQANVFGVLEKGRPAPPNTIWNVASLTKPITALVALKLINEGKLSLDESLSNYFTDPDIATDPRTKKLTVRIILSHQTGFPNWRRSAADGKLAFEFEPGTKYQYSGEGYEYLRKALEKKFNKTFDLLAAELIFQPLQMKDTRFFWDANVDSTRFAKWHKENGNLYETYKNTSPNAADDLLTTVDDYCKFVLYVMNGAGLSKKLYDEMLADQVRMNASQCFGLGWYMDENINANNNFAVIHGGDDIGVHTIVFILPASKQALVIFTNSDNGTSVFADVLLKFFGHDGQGIIDIEMKKK